MSEALYQCGEHQQAAAMLYQALTHENRPLPSSRFGTVCALIQQGVRSFVSQWLPGKRKAASERNVCRAEVARSFSGLGATWDFMARFRMAHYYHGRAVVWAEQAQHPLTLGLAYFYLGYHEECLGTWDLALTHYRKSADFYREMGDVRSWGTVTTCLCRIYMQQGHFARSLAESEQLILIGQEGADPLVWSWGLMRKGDNLMRLGQLDDAIVHLQRAIKLIQFVQNSYALAEAQELLARCYVRQGRLAEAVAITQSGAPYPDEHGLNHNLKRHAEVYLGMAERASGTERDRTLRSAKQACQAALKSSAFCLGEEPRAWRLYGTCAWLQGQTDIARSRWQKSLQRAEQLGAQWELGMTYLDMGMHLADAGHLQRAESLLTTLCAAHDAAQAHQRRDQLRYLGNSVAG